MTAERQLQALGRLGDLLTAQGFEYWVFGGWAVDFHAGSVTREHSDIDIAVWLKDYPRIAALLSAEGWEPQIEEGQDGYVAYAHGVIRLELAFLERGPDGVVHTPLEHGTAPWPEGAFSEDVREVNGHAARVMSLAAVKADKAEQHNDADTAAKDRYDLATLEGLG